MKINLHLMRVRSIRKLRGYEGRGKIKRKEQGKREDGKWVERQKVNFFQTIIWWDWGIEKHHRNESENGVYYEKEGT